MEKKLTYPIITSYARLLDRITMTPLSEFQQCIKTEEEWNLGVIHGYYGGFSQYLVELDIWNNEPDISGGFTQLYYDDAENCNIEVLYDKKVFNNIKLVQIKNNVLNNKDKFEHISNNECFKVYGNFEPNKIGVLNGKGDHAKVLIGINLQEGANIDENELRFIVRFNFESEGIQNHIDFNCYVSLIKHIIPLNKTSRNETSDVIYGEIYNNNGKTRINAYNEDGYLQDQYITDNNKFYLFLKNGIYNIFIDNDNNSRQIYNFNVEKGIQLNYLDIDGKGLIYKLHENICEYLDVDENNNICIVKQIFGKLVDEYNNSIENSEILLIQDYKLKAYVITDKNGQYKFLLDDGNYILKMRRKDRNLQIYNICIDDTNTFIKNNNKFLIQY